MNTSTLGDFEICVSVPLTNLSGLFFSATAAFARKILLN